VYFQFFSVFIVAITKYVTVNMCTFSSSISWYYCDVSKCNIHYNIEWI